MLVIKIILSTALKNKEFSKDSNENTYIVVSI